MAGRSRSMRETGRRTGRSGCSTAVWDTFAATGVVRRFAVAGLDEAARRSGRRRGLVIGALDETGQEKQGTATTGVQRQYLGCAGRVANGINTVHLAYVHEHAGHALIGARQWIPRAQTGDPVRSLLTGVPLDLEFRTKGQLAIGIAAEALADGICFDSSAGMRSTAAAPNYAPSSKPAARARCCASRGTSTSPSPAAGG
jgi:hypothetical protein